MFHPFFPATVLVFLPALALAWRLELFQRRSVRAALAVLAFGIVAWSIAVGGVSFETLKKIKLFVVAATAAIFMVRSSGIGLGRTNTYRATLVTLAAVSILVHLNFMSFHGKGSTREFVHLHDVAHYYLGSKYFRELAHADLYAAMLRAEAERFGPQAVVGQARDLRTNRLVPAQMILRQSNPVKAGFTPTRWRAFVSDVSFFRATLNDQYRPILRDHGYNPTPLWTMLGGSLANLVPAGSTSGIRALALIDPLLELAMFSTVYWAFGLETALIAIIYFCNLFGASFGWLGGAFLRHLWLAALIGSACCLHKNRPRIAGALLALSTSLRVFPIFFALGPLYLAINKWRDHRALPRRQLHFIGALLFSGAALFAASTITPRGLDSWSHFATNMERHVQNTAYNTIGLNHLTATVLGSVSRPVDRNVFDQLQLVTLVPLTLFWLLRRSRTEKDLDAIALGLPLIFVGLNLACYYYVALLVLILRYRNQAAALALIFAIEAGSYSFLLFEPTDTVLYLYRNVLVLLMLAALFSLTPTPPGQLDGNSAPTAG